MQYEVKTYTTPNTVIDKGADTLTYTCGVITKIVGQPYAQFEAGDTTQVVVSNYSTKTGAQIEAELDAAIASFVASKYPNT